ncbi:MAG: glycosyltransferase family 2 protein [Candidatus Altiarchaeota archaeon]
MLVSVIIPMYNEEANAQDTLKRVDDVLINLKQDYEIVVVDDGSVDNTARLAEEAAKNNRRIAIAYHKTNRGLGEALRTGFGKSKGDVIVTIDADLSYAPENIPKLIAELEDADIAVGSPYMKEGKVEGIPCFRLMLSKIGNKIVASAMSTKIHTVTSMFRAYKKEVIESMFLESSGPEIMPEIISKASAIGFKIKEIPVVLKARMRGKSKFKLFSGLEKHLMLSLYEKPAALMALFGTLSMIAGVIMEMYLGYLYLHGALEPTRPLMTIAPLLIISGIQLLFFGIVASEIVQIKKEVYRIQARKKE